MKWFFDFDHTLYDTEAMFSANADSLSNYGYPRELIYEAREALKETGYTLEKMFAYLDCPLDLHPDMETSIWENMDHGDKFLFPDVLEFLSACRLKDEVHLVTFGDSTYQARKVAGVSKLRNIMDGIHIVFDEESKGDVIRRLAGDEPSIFVDDAPRHLEDVLEKAPACRVARMMRYPDLLAHPGDGVRWPLVQTLDELRKIE